MSSHGNCREDHGNNFDPYTHKIIYGGKTHDGNNDGSACDEVGLPLSSSLTLSDRKVYVDTLAREWTNELFIFLFAELA